jgi:UPF0755 protein
LNLSASEVTTLATIVQSEQCCDYEEKRIIAGLYLNRLAKDMRLESDPTVIFAIGDFTIQKVYFSDIEKAVSPYNTYLNKGLPPGPIGFALKSSITAVLDKDDNDYIFMCAKEDFSGKHYFTKSYEQHKINAEKYRAALKARGIKR